MTRLSPQVICRLQLLVSNIKHIEIDIGGTDMNPVYWIVHLDKPIMDLPELDLLMADPDILLNKVANTILEELGVTQ